MKYLLCLFTAIILSGCASTMDSIAGIGVINESTSTFDGSRIISVSPSWVAGATDTDLTATKIGARWNSSTPEYVALLLSYSSSVNYGDSYVSFSGLKINIGGSIKSFTVTGSTSHSSSNYNSVSNDIYTQSEAVVVIPMALLRDMLTAEDVRLRIEYLNEYEDVRFNFEESGYGQRLAKSYIAEMLSKI